MDIAFGVDRRESLKVWIIILVALCSFYASADQTSSMSLLDNRFRVDPSIKQINFVIYRAKPSKPAVLVRPDGEKYYVSKHPSNVKWYQESSMDIISIDNPMPGPWQAIGKITPKNNIVLISHLKLSTDRLPYRLYQGELLKFNARLTADGEPLILRDFLNRVKLKVIFTKFIENEESLASGKKPSPEVIGEFADNGKGLDEVAGDGVFTVELPITSAPGKYRAQITSGNGVFMRAQEQEVLVYPTPVQATFIQSHDEEQPNQVVVSGEDGIIEPGSLAGTIEHITPYDDVTTVQGSADPDQNKFSLEIQYSKEVGLYNWTGEVFATDLGSHRPLSFQLTKYSYFVVKDPDLANTRRIQEQERLARQKKLEMLQVLQVREEKRTRTMTIIAVTNIVIILVGLLILFVIRKLKASKEAVPEMQLEMPKE